MRALSKCVFEVSVDCSVGTDGAVCAEICASVVGNSVAEGPDVLTWV